MTEGSTNDDVVRRLNIMISLHMDSLPDGPKNMTEKILRLSGFGLGPAEIGEIVGKRPNYVSAVVSGKKRSASTKFPHSLWLLRFR